MAAEAAVFAVRHSKRGAFFCVLAYAMEVPAQAIRTTEISNSRAHHPLLDGQAGSGGWAMAQPKEHNACSL